MKKTLILFALIATTFSCKKSSNPTTPVVKNSVSDISVASIKSTNSSLSHVDPQYNLLGYGYDITGKYADTSSVRSLAIEVKAYDIDNPGRVVFDLSSTATTQTLNAENADSLLSQLSSRTDETNGLKMFKGTITTPFGGQDALSSKYVYGVFSVIIQQKRVKMMSNYDLLKNYLTPSFANDIKVLSAADLVKKYGTHILSDIVLGAKLNAYYQAESNSGNRLSAESNGLTYAISKVFGLSTGALDPVNMTELASISSPKIVYEAVGADQSKLVLNTTTNPVSVDITNWHLSSTRAGAAFIDISKQGLMPIYELITDPVKKAEVKAYIATYLSN